MSTPILCINSASMKHSSPELVPTPLGYSMDILRRLSLPGEANGRGLLPWEPRDEPERTLGRWNIDLRTKCSLQCVLVDFWCFVFYNRKE